MALAKRGAAPILLIRPGRFTRTGLKETAPLQRTSHEDVLPPGMWPGGHRNACPTKRACGPLKGRALKRLPPTERVDIQTGPLNTLRVYTLP